MSDLTRRTVLGASATGLAASVVASAADPVAAAPARPAGPITRRFTSEHALYRRGRYLKRRGSAFWVTGTGVRLTMKLVKVSDISGASRGSLRSFELTFRASRKGPTQGTYTLSRKRFAATSLFLVPTDADRRTYRAVVNNR